MWLQLYNIWVHAGRCQLIGIWISSNLKMDYWLILFCFMVKARVSTVGQGASKTSCLFFCEFTAFSHWTDDNLEPSRWFSRICLKHVGYIPMQCWLYLLGMTKSLLWSKWPTWFNDCPLKMVILPHGTKWYPTASSASRITAGYVLLIKKNNNPDIPL